MQGLIRPLPHRCTRKSQCRRATQPNQWLWTYENGLCLHIQSVLPAHHPRQEQGQVSPIFLLSFCLCPHPPCLDPSASAPWPPQKAPTCWASFHVPQVTLLVPRLPTLAVDEYFHCAFGNYDSLAHVEGPQLACVTPPQDQLPLNPPGTGEGPLGQGARAGTGRGRSHLTCPADAIPLPDHITLPLVLMFEDVPVAATNFSFYDCGTVAALEAAAP